MALSAAKDKVSRVLLRAAVGLRFGGAQKMAAPACCVQVAHITAPANRIARPGVKKPKPWPYKKKRFTCLSELLGERTIDRIDENSKVIVVEGNMGVGKTDFAKKLAQELDFHYVPATTADKALYEEEFDFDLREIDYYLSEGHKVYDLERFYADPHPERGRGGMLQLYLYRQKFFDYAEGLAHLFNTGQGVVFDRSVFSDNVYPEALRKCGFMTPGGLRYYMENRRITLCELWKPHLTIYLDAPIDFIMSKIRERNVPYEMNSKIMSERYVRAVNDAFRDHLIAARKHGQILTYSADEMEDFEIIIEEIEALNLDKDRDDEDMFKDWHSERDDDWAAYRRAFSNPGIIARLFKLQPPWDHPELMLSDDERYELTRAMQQYPKSKFAPGCNPTMGDSFLSILLGLKSKVATKI